jgi:hypothetical protein
MRITIESTDKLVELLVPVSNTEDGLLTVAVEARVWQGETDSGIPVQVYVTRIAAEIPESDPKIDELTAQFTAELKRTATPRPTVAAIPLSMIL